MKGGGARGVLSTTTMITKSPYTTTTTAAADSWAHHHHEDGVGSGGWGLSWPPRFYTCNFCRREFRSAQALGGHMNVHRRDRARLRGVQQSPKLFTTPNPNPNLNLNLIPNPNPNPNPTQPTLPSSMASPSTHHNRLLSRYKHVGRAVSPQCAAIFDPKKLLVMRRQGNLSSKSKGRGVVRLGLEIGIFDHDNDDDDDDDDDDQDGDDDGDDDLDLELRLGYNH